MQHLYQSTVVRVKVVPVTPISMAARGVTDITPGSNPRLPRPAGSCIPRPAPSSTGSGRSRRHARHSSAPAAAAGHRWRSEEHTSELQSRENLVCRLLLEKKKEQLTVA